MSTYVLIEKYTVGAGGVSSVTLGSGGTLPQTFTDLKIVASIRSDYSSTNNFLKLTVNGNTTSLSNRFIYFFNTTVNSTSYGSPYNSICGTINGATSTSNTFSNFEMYAPNYTSSNYKSFSIESLTENNAASQGESWMNAMLWSNTSAITSLQFSPYYGTLFNQYSTFYLYGILKA